MAQNVGCGLVVDYDGTGTLKLCLFLVPIWAEILCVVDKSFNFFYRNKPVQHQNESCPDDTRCSYIPIPVRGRLLVFVLPNHDDYCNCAEHQVNKPAKDVPGPEEEMGEESHDVTPLVKVGSYEWFEVGIADRVRLGALVEVDAEPHGAAVDNDPNSQFDLP